MKTAEQIRKSQKKLNGEKMYLSIENIFDQYVEELLDSMFDNDNDKGYDEYYGGEPSIREEYRYKTGISFTFNDIMNKYGIPEKSFEKYLNKNNQDKLFTKLREAGYHVTININLRKIRYAEILIMWYDL